MLHPYFLLWIVLSLVALQVTPSSAAQSTFKAGDPGLQFSAGWTNSTFNGVPFVALSVEGNITALLPVGVTQVQYTGFKLPIPSLYRVCLDGICSTINATDPTANSPPPSVLFTLSVDPTSSHILAIVNAFFTSNTLTFISLGVTTADSNTVNSTSSSTSSAATASATPTNGNQQTEAGPVNHAVSTTIILLVLLGSISILVGLVVFLHRVRQQRLELINHSGDEETFSNQKMDPPNRSPAPSLPSIKRRSTFITSNPSQSRFENGLNLSSRDKSLPPAPAPSRPPSVHASTSKGAQLNEVRHLPHPGHPTFFLPSFLDFEEPSVSRFSASVTDHR